MFQFTGLPSRELWIHSRIPAHYCRRVPPFGYPRVYGCLHLTAAFRSLPRPSSAPIAKASALCSLFLNLTRFSSQLLYEKTSILSLEIAVNYPCSRFRFCLLIINFLDHLCLIDFRISHCSVFKVLCTSSPEIRGGPGGTRTSDLTLIRRAL